MDFKEQPSAFAECLKKDCDKFWIRDASDDSIDASYNNDFFIHSSHK